MAYALDEVRTSLGIKYDEVVVPVIPEVEMPDITFTVPRADGPRAVELIEKLRDGAEGTAVLYDDQIGKVSLVGAGMKSHPGVTAEFAEALRDAKINIEMITTSEIRITAVVREKDLDEATRAIHEKFQLGGDEAATVYAGTGR